MRARRGRSKAVEIWGWATAHRCVVKFSLMHHSSAEGAQSILWTTPSGVNLSWDGVLP